MRSLGMAKWQEIETKQTRRLLQEVEDNHKDQETKETNHKIQETKETHTWRQTCMEMEKIVGQGGDGAPAGLGTSTARTHAMYPGSGPSLWR